MIRAMVRCALALACLCGGLSVAGCDADRQNGQDCLKDDDCESRHCVARVCQQGGSLVPPDTAVADSPAEASDAPDSTDAVADTATDAADGG